MNKAYKKVEALVQGVRMTKTRLRAVGAEEELFSGCFVVGILVDKLEHVTQTRFLSTIWQSARTLCSKRYSRGG